MKRIEERLKEKINFVLLSMKKDFSLMGLDIKNNNGTKFLKILVDKPGGITIDDCVHISKKITVHLEVCDLITGSYRLEVSSPGVEKKAVR
jgi:ribosome maturation factor RimP